ncbi:hypothetical protein ColTof3_14140 [Colletotrichum tofieldiae]|nr:hypothetical protein ColTof3_14140 [Colletotrichum tofieldiae]
MMGTAGARGVKLFATRLAVLAFPFWPPQLAGPYTMPSTASRPRHTRSPVAARRETKGSIPHVGAILGCAWRSVTPSPFDREPHAKLNARALGPIAKAPRVPRSGLPVNGSELATNPIVGQSEPEHDEHMPEFLREASPGGPSPPLRIGYRTRQVSHRALSCLDGRTPDQTRQDQTRQGLRDSRALLLQRFVLRTRDAVREPYAPSLPPPFRSRAPRQMTVTGGRRQRSQLAGKIGAETMEGGPPEPISPVSLPEPDIILRIMVPAGRV